MAPISQAFRQAYEDNTIPRNPCDRVRLSQPHKGAGRALAVEEVGRLLTVARDDLHASRLYALFALAFNTAARIGEILALRWSAVDWHAGTLRIEASLKREGRKLVIGSPKTLGSYRTVPLTPDLLDVLRAHRARQNAEKLRAGADKWEDNDLLFCTAPDRNGTAPGGRPLDHSNIRRTWNRLLRQVGLRHYRLYDTRHTVLTRLAEAGENPDVARLLAGHHDVRTTLSYYTHTTQQTIRDAVSKLPTYPASQSQAEEGDESDRGLAR